MYINPIVGENIITVVVAIAKFKYCDFLRIQVEVAYSLGPI